ncbi:MAG TPA: CHASE3 domain-containing protein, partial [Flavisolibacter sp.]|nr:CHASE3 domain-containing protein [Flavisolibacter sp.]
MKNHSAENITGSISFEKKIIGYFLLVLLIIVSIIFIYKKISDDYKVSREWVTHTEHILTLSDSILANEKDIIIETRGYIITGNPNSLVSYKQNNLSFDTNLLKLKSLVKDNPLQEKRLDSVQNYYKKYTIIREHAIAIRNKKDFQLADEIPLIDAADKVLTDLHNIFNSIQADEKRLLVKRKEDFKQRTAASALVIRILLLVFIISLLLAFVIVYRNIVKRNKAENRVRQLNDELEKRVEENTKQAIQKEKQYRFLIENMREGIQVIGFDWRYLFVNNSVVRQGKYTNEELLGHTMMEKYPGIENTELFSVLSKCMTMRSPQILENEFTYPDNTTGWFELSIQPVPEGLFILSMDISKRKKAENTLVHSEEKRRLIMNA